MHGRNANPDSAGSDAYSDAAGSNTDSDPARPDTNSNPASSDAYPNTDSDCHAHRNSDPGTRGAGTQSLDSDACSARR